MPGEEVTIVQMCGLCHGEIGTFTVKRDNMMLSSKEQIWCSKCGAYTPEVRDIAGRLASIKREIDSYPKSRPADLEPRL